MEETLERVYLLTFLGKLRSFKYSPESRLTGCNTCDNEPTIETTNEDALERVGSVVLFCVS